MLRDLPLRRRFMFLPSNAASLARNIATSIGSRLTVSGLYCRSDLRQRACRGARGTEPPPSGGCRAGRLRFGGATGVARAARWTAVRRGFGATGSRAAPGDGRPGRIEQERIVARDATGGPVHSRCSKSRNGSLHRLRSRAAKVGCVVSVLAPGSLGHRQAALRTDVVTTIDRRGRDPRGEGIGVLSFCAEFQPRCAHWRGRPRPD